MRFSKILLIFLLCFSPLLADNYGKTTNINEEVTINFKELQIDDFIKLVSNILNKNILLQAPIPGNVDFISTTPVYKKDLATILQSVLGSKGYALVDRGSFLEIVRSKDATQFNLPLVQKTDENYIQMVTKIIAVKNVNVDFIASKIRHLGSVSASIVTIKDSNSLLITDFPKNIQTIERIIKEVERNDNKKTAFFKLKNTEVEYVFPSLLHIVKGRFDSNVETQQVTISQDKASNTIVAVGSEDNLNALQKIVEKFDKKGSTPEKITRVIPLKNTESKDVVTVVTQILKSKENSNPANKTIVVAEPNTNSIVVSGVREDIEEVKLMLDELDREQRQVFVKARIIEISQNKSDSIGLKYGLQAGSANSFGLFSMAMNMGGPPIAIDLDGLGIEKPKLKSGLALGAAIDFLSANGAAKIVSEPSILCLNNQESKIYVGQTQSIITSTKAKDNADDFESSTYSREDIGLTLKVKPRISNDGKVTLEAETIIEDALPDQKAGMPTTTKRQVTTKAIVKNGESVIVGGLIRDKSINEEAKIPILGSIPILGYAFRHNSVGNDNANIVIILTPYIINVSEDLTILRSRLAELDNLQSMYSKEFEYMLKNRQNKNQKEIDNKIKKDIKKNEFEIEIIEVESFTRPNNIVHDKTDEFFKNPVSFYKKLKTTSSDNVA